ncbi:hypothetical protein FACS189475_09190 [Betaproteobacteria bacterium]|nr:hypothetical protein FACS189475_09190 [Betaproteobacteria bacterium]
MKYINTLVLLSICSANAFAWSGMDADVQIRDAQPMEAAEIRVATLPPTAKSVIGAMFLSAKVPLSVDSSCHGVGTDFLDTTLGEYLSGFLAELNDPNSRNSVQVEITTDTLAENNGWLTRIWLGKAQKEEEWQWGIEFFVTQDGLVSPTSYRCIGAG